MKPSLQGPVQMGALYLLFLACIGGIFLLAISKQAYPGLQFPVFAAAPVFLALFLGAGLLICRWIAKIMENR